MLDVEGGWYLRCKCRAFAERNSGLSICLRDEGVLVQPGFFYDFESEAFLVVSLLTAPGAFREGIAACGA